MKLKILVLNAFLALALAVPGWAESKSMTIQVSCVVPPRIELSTASLTQAMSQNASSKETEFGASEQMRERDGRLVRVLSLTAL